MPEQTAGVSETLLDEPHVEGRRISVLQIRDRVEVVGRSPQEVAEDYDLDLTAVYKALAYYHANREEMKNVRAKREEELESLRQEIATNRPEGVTPPS